MVVCEVVTNPGTDSDPYQPRSLTNGHSLLETGAAEWRQFALQTTFVGTCHHHITLQGLNHLSYSHMKRPLQAALALLLLRSSTTGPLQYRAGTAAVPEVSEGLHAFYNSVECHLVTKLLNTFTAQKHL